MKSKKEIKPKRLKKDPNFISEGKHSLKINEDFFKRLNPKVDMERVRALFRQKMSLYDYIETNWDKLSIDTDEYTNIGKIKRQLTGIEFGLQEELAVPKDTNYHRFWNTPMCKCPSMDNEDGWGTPYHVINTDCPWHGIDLFNIAKCDRKKK